MRFDFENATLRDIDIRSLTEDCKENPGKVLTRGEKIGGNAYIGRQRISGGQCQ